MREPRRGSIRTRLIMAMVAGQILAALVIAIPVYRGRDLLILAEVEKARRGRLEVCIESHRELLVADPGRARKTIMTVLSHQPDIRYSAFVRPDRLLEGWLPDHRRQAVIHRPRFEGVSFSWSGDELQVLLPVGLPGGEDLALVAGFDASALVHRLDTLTVSVITLSLLALAAGFALTLALSHRLVATFESFAIFTGHVARGEPPPALPVTGKDEVGDLARALDHMATEITSAREVLQGLNEELEERVRLRTRELEEAHRKLVEATRLATAGRIAAEVAHEVRNPLTSLHLDLELVQEQWAEAERRLERAGPDPARTPASDGPGIRPVLAAMQGTLGRIEDLIASYLGFADARDCPKSPVRLEELEVGARQLLTELAPEGKVIWRAQLDSPQAMVRVNRARMILALKALLRNAVQAMRGEGILRFRLCVADRRVLLEIHDNGPGIAPELQDRVFEIFVTTHPNHAGLGLPLALQIVREHRGSLELECGDGAGTVARITLPTDEATEPGERIWTKQEYPIEASGS